MTRVLERLRRVGGGLRGLGTALAGWWGRDRGRAICPVDDWAFAPRYTDGVCPLCGWQPPTATAKPGWRVGLDPLVGAVVLLLLASVAMGVVVVLAYQRA